MKAYDIAAAFAAQFTADAAFTGTLNAVDQSGEDFTRPAQIFECVTTPMTDSGKALSFTLIVGVESSADKLAPADPDPALAHAARVEAVRAKLFGAGKAALLTELNAPAVFTFRGWSATPSDPAVAGTHFRTPVALAGVCLLL